MIIENTYKHQTGGLYKTISRFDKNGGCLYPIVTEKLRNDRENKYNKLKQKKPLKKQKTQ